MTNTDKVLRAGHTNTGEVLKHNWFRDFQFQRFMYRKIKAPWLPNVMGPSDTSKFEDFSEEAVDDHAKRFSSGIKIITHIF